MRRYHVARPQGTSHKCRRSPILVTKNRDVRKRAAQAFSAQLAFRVVVIGQQIFLTSLFLSRWGVGGYATWIAASAVASLASLANGGLGQAAAAEIIFKIRKNDQESVIALLSSAISILLVISMIWMLGTVGLIYSLGLGRLGATILGSRGTEVVLLLNIVILLEFASSPFTALLGAAFGAGFPAGIKVVIKVVETSGCAALLYFINSSQLAIASMMVFCSIFSFGALVILTLYKFPWIRYRPSLRDGRFTSTLIVTSLNNFLLYVSVNVVGIQLPRAIIPWVLSSSALALFATMTTYFRAVRSFCLLAPAAIQIEVSLAHGGGERERLKRMYFFTIHSAFWMSVIGGVTAIVAGPVVFPLWTRNLIAFDWRLALILLVGVIWVAMFDAITGLLVALNCLGRLPIIYTACMLVAMLMGVVLASGTGLDGYAAALVLPELIGTFVAAHQARRVTQIVVPWWKLLTDPPWREFATFWRFRRGRAPTGR